MNAEFERIVEIMKMANAVFVFGSNQAGIHGKGAAKTAVELYGAAYGRGEGIQGRSYGIPTRDGELKTLPLDVIHRYVDRFLTVAFCSPAIPFAVTRVGCGYAGYTDAEMAPLFKGYTKNCFMPAGW